MARQGSLSLSRFFFRVRTSGPGTSFPLKPLRRTCLQAEPFKTGEWGTKLLTTSMKHWQTSQQVRLHTDQMLRPTNWMPRGGHAVAGASTKRQVAAGSRRMNRRVGPKDAESIYSCMRYIAGLILSWGLFVRYPFQTMEYLFFKFSVALIRIVYEAEAIVTTQEQRRGMTHPLSNIVCTNEDQPEISFQPISRPNEPAVSESNSLILRALLTLAWQRLLCSRDPKPSPSAQQDLAKKLTFCTCLCASRRRRLWDTRLSIFQAPKPLLSSGHLAAATCIAQLGRKPSHLWLRGRCSMASVDGEWRQIRWPKLTGPTGTRDFSRPSSPLTRSCNLWSCGARKRLHLFSQGTTATTT